MASVAVTAPKPAWGRRALRLAAVTALFAAAGYLGRPTMIDGHGLTLIGPGLGVAGLWMGSGNRRTWPADLLALAIATVVVTTTTGAALPNAAAFTVTNLIQVMTFVLLVRAWIPDLWGFGGTRPLQRIIDLGRLTGAAAVSCVVGLGVGTAGAVLVTDLPPWQLMAAWWGRNTVALIVITIFGLLLGHPLVTAGGIRAAGRVAVRALTPAGPRRAFEVNGLMLATAVLACLIFVDTDAQALAFVLLVTTAWAGLRFSPLAVTVHGGLLGAFGVACTVYGLGPFAHLASPYGRALTAQAFVAIVVLTGLALSFSRVERDHAITLLAGARRAADDRAQLLDAVLESMAEGVVVVETGGRVLVRNTAGRVLLGLDEDDLPEFIQTASSYGLYRADGQPLEGEDLPALRSLAGEVVAPEDFHVRAPSVPHGRVVEISSHPLVPTAPDAPQRAMVNIRDVTVDRQHRDALASFAGIVAHDLFNPLSLVHGWTEALDDEFSNGPVSPTVGLPMVARIHQAATHMRDFIADLMAYTVARDSSLRSEEVDLTTIIRNLARLRANGDNAAVIAVDDGLRAWADPGLMRQLFDNLLGNAVKYVAPGTRPAVSISGTQVGERVLIRVTDNGIGVPDDHREQIFESFHRVRTDYHGTGLGLTICRRIVDRHGGTIHAEPGPGDIGTTFVLDLPATPAGMRILEQKTSTRSDPERRTQGVA